MLEYALVYVRVLQGGIQDDKQARTKRHGFLYKQRLLFVPRLQAVKQRFLIYQPSSHQPST